MIGFAVLGCGRIGRMHSANVARHPRAKLVACYDPVSEAAHAVSADTGAVASPSVEAALNHPGVEAVLIATSTDTHVDLIIAAAKAGKAVLCEKPIDLDMARIDRCWDAISDLDTVVMIGFNRRFDLSFKAVRDRVVAGEIGAVEQVVISSRDPAPPPVSYIERSGGLFLDMTIHDFDMARYLAGDIVEVFATGANLIESGIAQAGDIDAAMVVMRAASGALVHINNSRRCAYGYDQRIEVFGSEGMLQAHNQHATTVEGWVKGHTQARDPVQDFFIERYTQAYNAEIDHFVDCIEGRKPPISGFAEGREALRLAEAAVRSLKTGAVVRVAT